ncbi:MAG: GRP family sugar transporter [Enterococcus sp.]
MDYLVLVALVPMFAWGSIGLVSGKIGGNANQQTLGMTMGALVFSVIVFLATQPTMSKWVIIIGLLSGMFWSVGQNGQFRAMNHMGVSVAAPLSTGMQLFVTTAAGALLFNEWTKTAHYVYGITALVILIAGVYLTSRRDNGTDHVEGVEDDTANFSKGFRALIISTIGYGMYTIIITWAKTWTEIGDLAILLPQSIGMLAGAFAFSVGKIEYNKFVWRNSATGLLWGIGNMCMLMSVSAVGLAVGFSLSQMGIVISTIGGIYLLGERKTKKEMVYVFVGCALVLVGGILLGYMKTI